ncbi:hypothetical protein NQZ68_030543 [Dissostichus eleginoides]|nr:hypothetical protein NQZ68_030543 [Dissostichus eleginoides]
MFPSSDQRLLFLHIEGIVTQISCDAFKSHHLPGTHGTSTQTSAKITASLSVYLPLPPAGIQRGGGEIEGETQILDQSLDVSNDGS